MASRQDITMDSIVQQHRRIMPHADFLAAIDNNDLKVVRECIDKAKKEGAEALHKLLTCWFPDKTEPYSQPIVDPKQSLGYSITHPQSTWDLKMPLGYAIAHGKWEIASLLLEEGAPPLTTHADETSFPKPLIGLPSCDYPRIPGTAVIARECDSRFPRSQHELSKDDMKSLQSILGRCEAQKDQKRRQEQNKSTDQANLHIPMIRPRKNPWRTITITGESIASISRPGILQSELAQALLEGKPVTVRVLESQADSDISQSLASTTDGLPLTCGFDTTNRSAGQTTFRCLGAAQSRGTAVPSASTDSNKSGAVSDVVSTASATVSGAVSDVASTASATVSTAVSDVASTASEMTVTGAVSTTAAAKRRV